MNRTWGAAVALATVWAWAAMATAMQAPAPAPASLAAGDVVPPFDAEGIDGNMHHVAYGKTPTILLFFLSSCPHCQKQIPEWNRAYERRPAGVNGGAGGHGEQADREAPRQRGRPVSHVDPVAAGADGDGAKRQVGPEHRRGPLIHPCPPSRVPRIHEHDVAVCAQVGVELHAVGLP